MTCTLYTSQYQMKQVLVNVSYLAGINEHLGIRYSEQREV